MTPLERHALVQSWRTEIKKASSGVAKIGIGKTPSLQQRAERVINRARAGADRFVERGNAHYAAESAIVHGQIDRTVDRVHSAYSRWDDANVRRTNMQMAARMRANPRYGIRQSFIDRGNQMRAQRTAIVMRDVAGSGSNRWRGSVVDIGREARAQHPAAPPVTHSEWTDPLPTREHRVRARLRVTRHVRRRVGERLTD